jgi:hypothetical protein
MKEAKRERSGSLTEGLLRKRTASKERGAFTAKASKVYAKTHEAEIEAQRSNHSLHSLFRLRAAFRIAFPVAS